MLAPRIVNDVLYVTRINHETHFAWQAQYRGGNAWTAQFNHAFVDPKCGPQKRVVAVVCPF